MLDFLLCSRTCGSHVDLAGIMGMLAYANYPEEFDTFQMFYCECRRK